MLTKLFDSIILHNLADCNLRLFDDDDWNDGGVEVVGPGVKIFCHPDGPAIGEPGGLSSFF